MADQEHRTIGDRSPAVQPPCSRQVKHLVPAAQFHNHSDRFAKPCSFFRHPQRVGYPWHRTHKQFLRLKAEAAHCSRCMGKSGLAKGIRRADPDHWRRAAGTTHQPEHKSGSGTCITRFGSMNFAERGKRQPAAHGLVKSLHAGNDRPGARISVFDGYPALANNRSIISCSRSLPAAGGIPQRVIMPLAGGHSGKRSGQPSFNSGNGAAQGNNSLLRHGMLAHGGIFCARCSLYVLMDSRAMEKSQAVRENFFLFCIRCQANHRSKPLASPVKCIYMAAKRSRNGTHLPDTRMAEPTISLD